MAGEIQRRLDIIEKLEIERDERRADVQRLTNTIMRKRATLKAMDAALLANSDQMGV